MLGERFERETFTARLVTTENVASTTETFYFDFRLRLPKNRVDQLKNRLLPFWIEKVELFIGSL